jgi:tetratricopeptide (TPR) repeat protein
MLRIGREIKQAKLVASSMTGLMKIGRPDLAMKRQIEILSTDSGAETAIAAADKSGLDLTDPAHSLALRALIAQLASLDRHDEAQKRVAAALELHPEAAAFHDLSGRAALASGGDSAKARASFERALELEAERATALIGLAEIAAAAGETQEAIALYDRAVASAPDDPAAARAAVALLWAQDRFEERERRLAEMVARNPRDAVAANALAVSLAERGGDLDQALAAAKRAAFFAAAIPEAQETLGWVHLLRVEHASAVEVLQAAVDARPDVTSARYRLGQALAASGNADRARAEFDAVISAGGEESGEAKVELARLKNATEK